MKYFDSLYRKLINEADGPLFPSPAGAGAIPPSPAGVSSSPLGAAVGSALPTPPSTSAPKSELTALTSQKKLQLTKLIALALKTPITDNNSRTIHKLRTLSTKPVVQGNAVEQEKAVINSIAEIQGEDIKSILIQIKYIPAETQDETSTNFISPDEYASLVSLARAALTTSANSIGGMDKVDISAYDITPNNVDEKIKEFKNLMTQSL